MKCITFSSVLMTISHGYNFWQEAGSFVDLLLFFSLLVSRSSACLLVDQVSELQRLSEDSVFSTRGDACSSLHCAVRAWAGRRALRAWDGSQGSCSRWQLQAFLQVLSMSIMSWDTFPCTGCCSSVFHIYTFLSNLLFIHSKHLVWGKIKKFSISFWVFPVFVLLLFQ